MVCTAGASGRTGGVAGQMEKDRNDRLTLAAIGLIAMCMVTVDHETLGHGSVCLILHGRILLLTSALFRCSVPSGWIDVGGPAMNLLMGVAAWTTRTLLHARFLKLRLFLTCVTAFSFFWEGGYLIHAMHQRKGHLYDFARFLFGPPGLWQRWAGAAAGLALFVFSARLLSRSLLQMWPDAQEARRVARTIWIAAAAGASLAGAAYTAHDWGNFGDSVLEIAVASFPMLLVPFGGSSESTHSVRFIARSYGTIVFALVAYAAFVATVGRGIAG